MCFNQNKINFVLNVLITETDLYFFLFFMLNNNVYSVQMLVQYKEKHFKYAILNFHSFLIENQIDFIMATSYFTIRYYKHDKLDILKPNYF